MRIAPWCVLVVLAACGGKPPVPKRGVVEADLGAWKFRRFQGPLLDVEVWVDGNKAEAYTASYVTNTAEMAGHVEDKDIVNVFVTKYERDDGVIRETVKLVRRLASEKGYKVDEGKIGGARALSVVGDGEAWVIWPSKRYVVKVGGRGRIDVPETLVEKYAMRFPSQLPGGALEGPLPTGPEAPKKQGEKYEYDPKNPKPDIEKYDPKKVKIPERKDETPAPAPVEEPKKAEPVEDPKKTAKQNIAPSKKAEPVEETPKKKAKKSDDDEPKKVAKKADVDEETPKKKAKKADDEAPKKVAKKSDDDEAPKKKAKKSDDDEAPRKKVKKSDDDDEAPKKKAKKSDDDEAPKKKAKKSDDDDEAPKKKAKKTDDDETPKKKKAKKSDDDDDEYTKRKKAKKDDDAAPPPKSKWSRD